MDVLLITVLILAGAVLIVPWSERHSLPGPVVMTLFGAALALIPAMPRFDLPGKLILPVILPPLLFDAARRSSTRDVRRQAIALVALAVGLVVLTTAAVSWTVHLWIGLPVAAALVLGAMVAPPDPVAATSIAGRLGLPQRMVALLEGEGLLNDATALVLYTLAVSWAISNEFSVWIGMRILALSLLLAPAVGLALGWAGRWLLQRIDDARAEVALTLMLPYAAYIAVEATGGSGVLAVLVLGLYLGQQGGHALSASGFLAGTTVWSVTTWMVSGIAFGFVGFELTSVLTGPGVPYAGWQATAVACAVVIVSRVLMVFPLGMILRHSQVPGIGPSKSWRESTIIAFAGMRGVVTLATALALPVAVPHRRILAFAAIMVVAVTLLGQGTSLPWLIRGLRIRADDGDGDEVGELRQRTAKAALDRLHELCEEGETEAETAELLERRYARLAAAPGDIESEERQRMRDLIDTARELRSVERDVLLDLRARGAVGAAAADRVLADINQRELRDRRHDRFASDKSNKA